jgi:cytochrome c oxidase cbb3-type subunit 4
VEASRIAWEVTMSFDHDTLIWFSKSFGLFYLVALSLVIVLYVYWPSHKRRFDQAAHAILDDEDRPWR